MNNKKKFAVITVLIILVSIILSVITFALQIPPFESIVELWRESLLSLILNTIPIITLMLLVLAITSKISTAITVTSVVTIVIAYINASKVLIRSEPLVVADILSIKEGAYMVVKEGFGINKEFIFGIIAIIFISKIISKLLKNYKLERQECLKIAVMTLVVGLVLTKTVYSSEKIYNSFPRLQETETNIAQSYNDKGVIYSLIYNRDTHRIKKPEHYDAKYLKGIKTDFTYKNPEIRPHVVMIMGEAWSDISNSEKLKFYENEDPFENTKKIMEDSICTGNLIVPVYGGGTANTEYDALTGNSTLMLNEGIFTSFSAVRGDKNSIARVFDKNGYKTIGIHPNDGWFYNREYVYEKLGFQETHFVDDFKDADMKGGFVSEKDTAEFIINAFDENYKNAPLFEFAVTIQNHSPYDKKYEETQDTFTYDGELNPQTKIALENYFVGIRDMDAEIKMLTDYFETIDEPVMFVYFGDHKPYINDNFQALKDLGYDIGEESYKKLEPIYSTPYFIWGNEALKKYVSADKTYEKISANFLGSKVLNLATLSDTDEYYQYLDKLRGKMPVIFRFFYYTNDGETSNIKKYDDLTTMEKELLDEYRSISFDMAK